MKKLGLILCCLLFIGDSPRSAIPALAHDETIESYVTVQSRRDGLTRLTAERGSLAATGTQVPFVTLSNQIAELQVKLFEFDAALSTVTGSLTAARQLAANERSLLVDTQVIAGTIYIRRNEIQQAFHQLNDALELSRELKYRDGEAKSLAQMAVAYLELGKHREALSFNNQAFEIWREQENKRGTAQGLTTQGEIYMILDQIAESDAMLKSAETLWRSLNDPAELSNNLVDQNFLAIRQGQWQTALYLLNEAESLLVEKEAERYIAGKIATSFGEVYEAYGQLETALNYFREAQTLYRNADDKRAVIDASTLVGRVKARLGDYPGAIKEIQQVLTAAIETDNDLTIGLCYEDLGRVWLASGSYESARSAFESAIAHFTVINSQREIARSQIYLGQTAYLLGNLNTAESTYLKALRFFKATPDYTSEAALRFGLSKVAIQLGQLDKAREHLNRSLTLTKRLRENASSKDLRSSFLDSVHDRYETWVELLMARNEKTPGEQLEIQAFEASESGRALALLDSLHDHGRELRRPSDPLLLVEEEKLQNKEQQLIDSRAALVSRGARDEEIKKIQQELMETRSRYETLQARINTSAKFTELLWPQPSYEGIRKQLINSETSLLEYSLGDENSFAWIVTENGLKTVKLADAKTIESAANKLVALLQKVPIDGGEESQLQDAINEVSKLILEPLADQLRTSRLIIVPDGALQNVPFQVLKALPTTSDPLVAQFDIVETPSASALLTVRQERMHRRSGTKTLVGFGDAVFSADYTPASTTSMPTEPSASRSRANGSKTLPRLFYAQRELHAISALAGSDSALYTEYAATRANLIKVDLSQYRILHVVTHGVVNDAEPELSGFYLSLIDSNHQPVSGFVGLADIYKLNAPVDLVVLSACQTSLGKGQRGEGLIGLTRGFMYAGATSVVASLWEVDDEVTAELMKYFYGYMLRDGLTPPAALRAAQNTIRSQPKWKAPYFWAGFTIQGDPDVNLKASPPVPNSRSAKLIAMAALVVLLLGVGYWYRRRRRIQRKN